MNFHLKYKTLILAGYGVMGRAFCVLGSDFISRFEYFVIIDKHKSNILPEKCDCFIVQNINNTELLYNNLKKYCNQFIFVNLTSNTDTFKVRQVIARLDGAYIDTSCSVKYGIEEYEYSKLMPYTLKRVKNKYPHFVCCGVNPGMVEIIAKKIIAENFLNTKDVDVYFFEYDQFTTKREKQEDIPVSWSPDTLIDEVMLTPSLELRNGLAVEGESAPTYQVRMNWFGDKIQARLVGHEEVWNLQFLPEITVRNSYYIYALHPDIMDAFNNKVEYAKERFYIPDRSTPVYGSDTLVVEVVDCSSGISKSMFWSTDHFWTFSHYSINAVQYQVCSSLLFFCELLIRLDSRARGNTYCGTTLVIDCYGWDVVYDLFKKYKIEWEYIQAEKIFVYSNRKVRSNSHSLVQLNSSSIHGIVKS
jgi:hypothetical protein